MKKRLSIVGLGWYGMELAKTLKDRYDVFGTKRNLPEHNSNLRILPLEFTPAPHGAPLSEVLEADYLVLNIPPGARSENAVENYRKMMDALIDAIALSPIRRAIFISSTGVFGQNEGNVNEETVPVPSTAGGRILFEAEQRFLSLSSCETFIIRPAGLVGEDRHPVKYMAGREGISGRLNPVNLVHRKDLIQMTEALLNASEPKGRVFHASAKEHPSKEDYYTRMAELKGMSIPKFDEGDNSKGKVVSAEKSKEMLAVKFEFDDPFKII